MQHHDAAELTSACKLHMADNHVRSISLNTSISTCPMFFPCTTGTQSAMSKSSCVPQPCPRRVVRTAPCNAPKRRAQRLLTCLSHGTGLQRNSCRRGGESTMTLSNATLDSAACQLQALVHLLVRAAGHGQTAVR
jgi:hypothetical protein